MAKKESKPIFPMGLLSQSESIFEEGFKNEGDITHSENASFSVPTNNLDNSGSSPSKLRYNPDSDEFEGGYQDGWRTLGGGGIRWEMGVDQNRVYTSENGRGYFLDNRESSSVVKLPANPTKIGTSISFSDLYGSFATHPLTIDGNGSNVYGSPESMNISTDHVAFTITWAGGEQGWIITAGIGLGSGRVYAREYLEVTTETDIKELDIGFNAELVDIFVNGGRISEKKYSLSGSVVKFVDTIPSNTNLQVLEYTPIQLAVDDSLALIQELKDEFGLFKKDVDVDLDSFSDSLTNLTNDLGQFKPKVSYIFDNITDILATNILKVGNICCSVNNEFGIRTDALWKIATAADTTTFSKKMDSGLYANLMPRSTEEYASFGFGSTTDSAINLAATEEAHRVATLKTYMNALVFPAGLYPILTTNLTVPRRYFKFLGKGWDITTLRYVGPDLGDSVVLTLNNLNNPNLTRNHYYQTVAGFTVDGGMEQSKYASSVAINGHYPYVNIKSIGHFYANIDCNGLVGQLNCHSQGRQSPSNAAYSTRVGVSFNYNAWDAKGYLSNGISGRACIQIDGGETTLAVASVVGATSITVTDASKFRRHFILEVEPEGGDGTTEAPSIASISGNTITFVTPLTKAHAAGVVVRNPVFGINVNGATIEVGEVRIGNSHNVVFNGCYLEGARPVFSNYPRKVDFSNNIISETDALINSVNRKSEIRYRNNQQAFPLRITVPNRSGGVDSFFDLYNMPLVDVGGLTRKEGAISINETDSTTKNGIYLQDLVVRDTYDRSASDISFREMEFKGLFASAPAAGNVVAISMYNVIPSGGSFNGYTFEITARMRRDTSIIPGIAQVIGSGYNQNGTVGQETKTVAASYGSFWNETSGVRITFGASTSRVNVSCIGEPSGGQTTRFAMNGKISCVI